MIKIDRQLMWRKSNKHRSVGWCTSTSDRTTYLARRRLPPSINNFFRLCCPMGRRAGRQVEGGWRRKKDKWALCEKKASKAPWNERKREKGYICLRCRVVVEKAIQTQRNHQRRLFKRMCHVTIRFKILDCQFRPKRIPKRMPVRSRVFRVIAFCTQAIFFWT